jgi:hypothetical protein
VTQVAIYDLRYIGKNLREGRYYPTIKTQAQRRGSILHGPRQALVAAIRSPLAIDFMVVLLLQG